MKWKLGLGFPKIRAIGDNGKEDGSYIVIGYILGFILGLYMGYITPIMENQMEKKMENEMETGII